MDADVTVIEEVKCADESPERTLRQSLPSFARPTHIEVAVTRTGDGTVVIARMRTETRSAERTFRTSGQRCKGLGRAVSAWASIVADGWNEAALEAATPVSDEPPVAVVQTTAAKARRLRSVDDSNVDLFGKNDDARTSGVHGEVAIGAHVSDGLGTGSAGGVVVALVILLENGWVVRPQLIASSSMFHGDSRNVRWGALGGEICQRSRGNYRSGQGISIEACAHVEAGAIQLLDRDEAGTYPFLSTGPVVALRGDVGENIALEFRAVGLWHGAKAAHIGEHGPAVTPEFGGRGEIAILGRAF